MKARYLLSVISFFLFYHFQAQTFPGGVPGAEVWYMVNSDDLSNSYFVNIAGTPIKINPCYPGSQSETLFNFNPSIDSDPLCLWYNASLENTTGRDIFFVQEPADSYDHSYSNLHKTL